MTIDEMIAVLTAAKEGKKIQIQARHQREWLWLSEAARHSFDFWNNSYRVAPEPREIWVPSGLIPDLVFQHEYVCSTESSCRATWPGYKPTRFREVIE